MHEILVLISYAQYLLTVHADVSSGHRGLIFDLNQPTPIVCECEQGRLWLVCAVAQAHLSLRRSTMQLLTQNSMY